MGNKATATSKSGMLSPPELSPKGGGSSSVMDESKFKSDDEQENLGDGAVEESSESSSDDEDGDGAAGKKTEVQNIVITGPGRKDNAVLIKKLLNENTAAGYDVKMVNNDKTHASECSLPVTKWKIQVPRSWRTFSGDQCQKSAVVLFTGNIGIDDFTDSVKSMSTFTKKLEFMLSEYEELSRQTWIRKCAIIVCITKAPPETISGVFADVEFKNRAELMELVRGCFLVKSPKFWNALVFKTCDDILDLDLEKSVSEAKKKFSKDEENSLDRMSMYSGSKLDDSHKMDDLSFRSSMFSGSRGASLSMSDFNKTAPLSTGIVITRLPSGPSSSGTGVEVIATM